MIEARRIASNIAKLLDYSAADPDPILIHSRKRRVMDFGSVSPRPCMYNAMIAQWKKTLRVSVADDAIIVTFAGDKLFGHLSQAQ